MINVIDPSGVAIWDFRHLSPIQWAGLLMTTMFIVFLGMLLYDIMEEWE